jgi:hypothetical protein
MPLHDTQKYYQGQSLKKGRLPQPASIKKNSPQSSAISTIPKRESKGNGSNVYIQTGLQTF